MSVLVNKYSRVLVQGFTGKEGTFHAEQMISYGTNVIGGVTPGKGGTVHLDRPVFNTVEQAVKAAGANVSIIFAPPFAAAALASPLTPAAPDHDIVCVALASGAGARDARQPVVSDA